MAEPMTLEALLTLVERWQQAESVVRDDKAEFYGSTTLAASRARKSALDEVYHVDIAALKVLAQQHAAQLRQIYDVIENGGAADFAAFENAAEFLQPSGAQEPA